MMKKFVAVAALLALVCAAPSAWAKSRSGIVTVDIDLTAHEGGKEARLWLPYPVSDADQSITDVRVSGDYAESGVYSDRANGTPML